MAILKNKTIRKSIIVTIIILLIFRIGCAVPVPFINSDMMETLFGSDSLFDYADMLTGGALSQCSVFALGITPFINASIVMQLLGIAFDSLKDMQNGDQTDREKYDRITKIVGAAFSAIMGVGYYFIIKDYDALEYTNGKSGIASAITICFIFVLGSLICCWLSTLIDEIGAGSGMSLLIFAGIVVRLSSLPEFLSTVTAAWKGKDMNTAIAGTFIILFVLFAILYICYMSGSEVKVPISYAGSPRRSELPLKIMFGGVLPVIFATTVLSIPETVAVFLDSSSKAYAILSAWDTDNWIYIGVFALLIFAMNAYYTTTQFSPEETAQRLKEGGAVIPGVRPGKPTAEYLRKNVNKLICCGALALCIIAVVPMATAKISGLSVSFGGTSLIIVCSVALEVCARIKGQMVSYGYSDSIWGVKR